MSAYTGHIPQGDGNDCARICSYPVSDIMSARVAVLSFDDNLLTVQGIFASVKFRHIPVVDDHGEIIGIISDRDFLRVASPFFGTVNEQNRDKEIMVRKVGVIMTRNPTCATPDTSIREAVKLMNGRKISCLPIVEKGNRKLLGIVTWKDVVRAFCPDAFDSTRDSNRLKSGVKVDPETSESARLRTKAAESQRLRARTADSHRHAAGEDAAHQPPPRTTPRAGAQRPESDTRHISLEAPSVGQAEKLKPRTAGLAGSELAHKQRERMRDIYGTPDNSTSPADSARMRAVREDIDDELSSR